MWLGVDLRTDNFISMDYVFSNMLTILDSKVNMIEGPI